MDDFAFCEGRKRRGRRNNIKRVGEGIDVLCASPYNKRITCFNSSFQI